MGMKMALVHIKGDWAEHCGTLGFPNWTSGLRPCLFCTAATDSWFTTDGLDSQRFPFHLNTHEDYETACATCEIVVLVDSAAHARILPLLAYDNRASGCHGRCLLEDIPELNLKTDDRLEPSRELPNVGSFDDLVPKLPVRVTVWRQSEQTIAKHRNPMFSKTLGVTLPQTVTVDILHTLHSGIFAEYCKHTVWQLLGAEIWGDGTMTHEEKLHVSVLAMRAELGTWYAARRQSHPHETLTQVHDLALKMLGTEQHPKHKLSAAETWGLTLFCADACVKFMSFLGLARAERLSEAGRCCERFMAVLSSSGTNVPGDAHFRNAWDCTETQTCRVTDAQYQRVQ